jgi:hypothetical protein
VVGLKFPNNGHMGTFFNSLGDKAGEKMPGVGGGGGFNHPQT